MGPLAAADRTLERTPWEMFVMTAKADRPLLSLNGRRRARCADGNRIHCVLLEPRAMKAGAAGLNLLRRSGPLDDERNQSWQKRRSDRKRRWPDHAHHPRTLAMKSSCHHPPNPRWQHRRTCPDTTSPGVLKACTMGPRLGSTGLKIGDQSAVIGLGPAPRKEFGRNIREAIETLRPRTGPRTRARASRGIERVCPVSAT